MFWECIIVSVLFLIRMVYNYSKNLIMLNL